MSVLVSCPLFYTVTDDVLWDLPGDVLAAPALALCGLERCKAPPLSLLSCCLHPPAPALCGWTDVFTLSHVLSCIYRQHIRDSFAMFMVIGDCGD